jgi:hypothetical protein
MRTSMPFAGTILRQRGRTMLACVDLDYHAVGAVSGCVLFRDWSDADSADEFV